MKIKHGHYSDIFEEEARRIQKLCKERLNVDLTWVEATTIAAERSSNSLFDLKEIKNMIMKLRGII